VILRGARQIRSAGADRVLIDRPRVLTDRTRVLTDRPRVLVDKPRVLIDRPHDLRGNGLFLAMKFSPAFCRAFRLLPIWLLLSISAVLYSAPVAAQSGTQPTGANHRPAFSVIPLGVRGGLDESNLSAYLVAAKGSEDYISLDAGPLHRPAKSRR